TYSLVGQIVAAGGRRLSLGVAPDRLDAIAERIARGTEADMLVSSAGVSVGELDLVREALVNAGADLHLWKVDMRPGKPITFGSLAGKPVFGLPGNPVSAMVTFELFVRPMLLAMQGRRGAARPIVRATALTPIVNRGSRRGYLRVVLEARNGRWSARLTGDQGRLARLGPSGAGRSGRPARGRERAPPLLRAVRAGAGAHDGGVARAGRPQRGAPGGHPRAGCRGGAPARAPRRRRAGVARDQDADRVAAAGRGAGAASRRARAGPAARHAPPRRRRAGVQRRAGALPRTRARAGGARPARLHREVSRASAGAQRAVLDRRGVLSAARLPAGARRVRARGRHGAGLAQGRRRAAENGSL